MTTKSTKPSAETEAATESAYATEADQFGKPVGPEHDASFHAPDYYDPKTGQRIETPWDSETQKNDPGFDADVMAGTTEAKPTGDEGAGGEKTPK